MYKFTVIILVAGYIFLANFVVSQRYALEMHKKELNALSAKSSIIAKGGEVDLKELLLYAQKSGMVESKDTNSIIQDRSFAIIPLNY